MSIPSWSSNEMFISRGKEISKTESWSEFASKTKGLEDSRKRKKNAKDKSSSWLSRGDRLRNRRDKGWFNLLIKLKKHFFRN
jgi:hypothetical protein